MVKAAEIQIQAFWFQVQGSFQPKHGHPQGLGYATVTVILNPYQWLENFEVHGG